MKKLIVITILVFSSISVAFAADRQNIAVDKDWVPKDASYFMCNFRSDTPKTLLSKVRDKMFTMCNFYGAEVDGSNTLVKCNIIDTTPKPVLTLEQLKARKIELESSLTTNLKKIPKEYYQEWVDRLEEISHE